MLTVTTICFFVFLLSMATTTSSFIAVSPRAFSQHGSTSSSNSKTARNVFGFVVEVEVNPDHMDEFLEKIEYNAVHSRKEPQCQLFDVLQDQEQANKFVFYEVYDTPEGLDYHQGQAHFKQWTEFRDGPGKLLSRKAVKLDGKFMTL